MTMMRRKLLFPQPPPRLLIKGIRFLHGSTPASNTRPVYLPAFADGLIHVANVDPSLQDVIDKSVFPAFVQPAPRLASFSALGRSIIGQQVSGAAAKSILRKFQLLYHNSSQEIADKDLLFPLPSQVLGSNIEALRSAGLSARKAEYMQCLADAFESGSLSDDILEKANDDDVVDKIVAIKGIGRMLYHTKARAERAHKERTAYEGPTKLRKLFPGGPPQDTQRPRGSVRSEPRSL
jgi:hypothetical protein